MLRMKCLLRWHTHRQLWQRFLLSSQDTLAIIDEHCLLASDFVATWAWLRLNRTDWDVVWLAQRNYQHNSDIFRRMNNRRSIVQNQHSASGYLGYGLNRYAASQFIEQSRHFILSMQETLNQPWQTRCRTFYVQPNLLRQPEPTQQVTQKDTQNLTLQKNTLSCATLQQTPQHRGSILQKLRYQSYLANTHLKQRWFALRHKND